MKFKHELGKEAKDLITGFTGIITGRCEYLYGCATYSLVPKINKEGKRCDCEWFDEGRVRIIGIGIKAEEVRADKDGGEPSPRPSRD